MAARVELGWTGRAPVASPLVVKADWSDDALLSAVHDHVLLIIEQRGRIRGWMIDDTGIPKKGILSVGVARQDCDQLGKQDSCQVAVTLSRAADHASLPTAHRLYQAQAQADDWPNHVAFQASPPISAAVAAGVLTAAVRTDAR